MDEVTGPTAVVVDRWPVVRLGLRGVLAGAGVGVVAEAAKAAEGLRLVRAHSPELLVVGSPTDGLSASIVRTAKRTALAPKLLLLLSGATPSEAVALFAAGAEGLVMASSAQEELALAVRRILDGERVVGTGLGVGGSEVDARGEGRSLGAADARSGILTAKEREVLTLLAQGHSNKQIARALFIGGPTVKTHLAHVYAKLGVQSRHRALARAAELGLLL